MINGIAEKKEGKAKIEGYKIVNNLKEWMGTLLCDYRSEGHKLTCAPRKGKTSYWTFQGKDRTMSGTLALPQIKALSELKRIPKPSQAGDGRQVGPARRLRLVD